MNTVCNRWDFSVYEDDSIIAKVTLKVDLNRPESMSLWNVKVTENSRKQRIATNLVSLAIDTFNNLDDYNTLWLRTSKENLIAIELYKKCGFEIIDDPDRAGNNSEKVVMILIKH